MQLRELVEVLALHPEIDVLAKELSKKREKHFLLSNLHASAQSIMLYEVMRREARVWVIVLDNTDEAQYMYADLRSLTGDNGVYFFPSSHRRRQGMDEAMAVQRTEVLTALVGERREAKGERLEAKGERLEVKG